MIYSHVLISGGSGTVVPPDPGPWNPFGDLGNQERRTKVPFDPRLLLVNIKPAIFQGTPSIFKGAEIRGMTSGAVGRVFEYDDTVNPPTVEFYGGTRNGKQFIPGERMESRTVGAVNWFALSDDVLPDDPATETVL